MCVYSMIADHYRDMWKSRPWYSTTSPPQPVRIPIVEVEELRRQVPELKELLKRAIKYDEDNGEPDCELEEKVAILKKVASMAGVDISEVTESKK